MELNKKLEILLESLNEIPPDYEAIEFLLKSCLYTPEDVSLVGAAFVEGCSGEFDTSDPNNWIPLEPHSAYVYQIVSLLLKYGLDPNSVYDGWINIMWELRHLRTDYVGADTLRLLLEHGGDVNLEVEDESLFRAVDFDVMFDTVNQHDREQYDALIHYWLVLIGFGARLQDGRLPVELFKAFDPQLDEERDFGIREFRDHQNYYFGLSNVPSKGENWSLHIFDKRSQWEVARL